MLVDHSFALFLPAQSAALVYDRFNGSLSAYARPGGLVVAGRANYAHRKFKKTSAAGGTVLIYLDCVIDNAYGHEPARAAEVAWCPSILLTGT